MFHGTINKTSCKYRIDCANLLQTFARTELHETPGMRLLQVIVIGHF